VWFLLSPVKEFSRYVRQRLFTQRRFVRKRGLAFSISIFSTLRILVISSCGPSDLYLIRELAARFPVCGIIRPVPAHAHSLNWKNFLKRPLKLLRGATNQRFMAYRSRKTNAWTARILFGEACPQLPENIVDIPITAINSPTTVEKISALAPDLILVCGAPMLAPEIFNISRLATLNIHFGIAPNYRGEHTLLWPLRVGDYQNIGITIHHIDEGIDTGRPLVRGFPALDKSDTEKTISLKCIRMAPRILIPIVESMLNTGSAPILKPDETANSGLLIRYQDRKLSHA
jgi:methionyl-tRNA formyltransferase